MKYRDPESKDTYDWKHIMLFKFNDAQVNSRSTTWLGKGDVKNVITQFLYEANPYEKPHLLKGASPKTMGEIHALIDQLLRALYTIADRKAMEYKFKSMPKGTLDLTFDENGNVTVHQHPKYKGPYDKEKVKMYLNSPDDKEQKFWSSSYCIKTFIKKCKI